jgi:putative ABC transport system permease protein
VLAITLLMLSVVMAFVGLLGLASAMSTSVIERTREFGVMRAVGARSAHIFAIVLVEGVLTAAASTLVSIPLSLPVTIFLGSFIGRLAFFVPLPIGLSIVAALAWSVLVVLGAGIATAAAAAGASRLTIRESLAYL